MRRIAVLIGAFVIVCLAARARAEIKIDVAPAPKQGEPAAGIVVPKPGGPGETAPAPAADPRGDALLFLGGDVLHGKLLGLDAKTIEWRHPDAADPIRLGTKNIDEVRFAQPPRRPAKPLAVVSIAGGDRIEGTVAELSADQLVLDTWYAGTLRVRRALVEEMTFRQISSQALYEGPENLESWSKIDQSIRGGRQPDTYSRFKNGALYLTGQNAAVGRDLNLPDMAEIRFDIAWRGYSNLMIYFYASKLQTHSLESYLLNLSGDYVNLQRWAGNNCQQIGNFNVQGMSGRGKLSMTLLVDKKQKKVAIKIDDRLVQQWSDTVGDPAKLGKGLMFYSYQGAVRIANISVRAWDGRIEVAGAETGAPEGDTVHMVNGDKVTGAIKGIREGQVEIQTSYAAMPVPLDRVAGISLTVKKPDARKPEAGALRAFFDDERFVTLVPDRIVNDQLLGSSTALGKVTMNLKAFRKLQFNLEAKRDRDDDDWDSPSVSTGAVRGGRGMAVMPAQVLQVEE